METIFNKALASLGVGGARVDTRLESPQYQPGDIVRGEVVVRGEKSVKRWTTSICTC